DLKELDKLAGRDLTFAGIVTKAEHRIAKSGKPFGSLSLEDHHGSFDLMFFSEDYLKFKLYMQTGALLLLRAKVAARTWGRDEGQMELKVYQIDLLTDARDKYFTKLTLKLDADRIDETVTRELSRVLMGSPGKCKVQVVLFSETEQVGVDVASKACQVAVTEELVHGLNSLTEVQWSLN